MRTGDEENILEGLCTQSQYSTWAGQAHRIGVVSEMGWFGAASRERTCQLTAVYLSGSWLPLIQRYLASPM